MPPLFWLDVAALGCTVLLSTSLLLVALGSRYRSLLALTFMLFAGASGMWAACTLLLKLSLWLGRGNALLLSELAALFLGSQGPLLLAFAARFPGGSTRAPDGAVVGGLAALAALSVPLFLHYLALHPRLAANGSTVYGVTPLGMILAAVPVLFLVWSLVLFLRYRRASREPFLSVGVLLLLAGLVAGGLFRLPFPVLTFATTLGTALLGAGVVKRQGFNSSRERARRLELLAAISRKTTAILQLDELLHQAIALIREQFGYFNVSILMVEGEYLVLRAAALDWMARLEGSLRLAPGREGVTGWVAGNGRPLLVPDVSREPRFMKCDEQVLTKSELAVPIMLKGEVIGVLDAQSAELNAFSPIDVYTLQTVADQLAIAVENARLYDETRQRAERLAVVNRIAAAAGATLRLDDLMAAVYREVTAVFRADAFFIALYDEAAGELDFRFQMDEGVQEPRARQPLGQGLSAQVIREKRPLLIREFQQERPRLPMPALWGTMKLPSSWLGVPMRLGERVTGLISVQAYRPRAFGEEEQMLLSTLADQVAVAVENARLFETVQAELEERRQAEEKFRDLAEQSPNMIFINSAGRVVYANARCEELMGYTREELYAPGFEFLSLIAPDSVGMLQRSYALHLRGEEVPSYEYSLITKDGRRLEAILHTRLIRYGEESAILGTITDITSRKRTERLLKALNAAGLAMERALSLEEILPTAGAELRNLGFQSAVFLRDDSNGDLRLGYLSHDPAAIAELEGLVGLKARDFMLPPESAAGYLRLLSERRAELRDGLAAIEAALPESLRHLAQVIAQKAGIQKSIAAPLAVGELAIGILTVHADDLTEEDVPAVAAFANQIAAAWRKARLMGDLERSLEQLKRAQEQLVQSQKMEAIGRLAGGIAHDFNNLLTAIGGYTELLLTRFPSAGAVHSDLEEIKRATSKAGSLTRQLLAFSRKQVLQPKVLDLNEVIGGMQKMLCRLLGEHIELITVLSAGIGQVLADPMQIEQVIMNLAINAGDAMAQGGRLILETANVELERVLEPDGSEVEAGSYVMIAVSDTGVGMDPDTQSRLFEPFFTTKALGKGTGLGLSTVYGIVKQSGGHIEVYSKPGFGSTFKVFLARAEEITTAPRKASLIELDPRGTETILLVEDEAVVRDLVGRVLEGLGYTVLQAEGAEQALNICGQLRRPLHLLISDVVLPGINGWELGCRLREAQPEARLLFMSGYTASSIMQRGILEPGVPFLQKPFSPQTLARRVREVLDG
jgi:PAS domain S-box-containing protein